MLDNDLENYCLAEEDTVLEHFYGSQTINEDQVYGQDLTRNCRRTKIFICEHSLLNYAFLSQYSHVVVHVNKGESMMGSLNDAITFGRECIHLTYLQLGHQETGCGRPD